MEKELFLPDICVWTPNVLQTNIGWSLWYFGFLSVQRISSRLVFMACDLVVVFPVAVLTRAVLILGDSCFDCGEIVNKDCVTKLCDLKLLWNVFICEKQWEWKWIDGFLLGGMGLNERLEAAVDWPRGRVIVVFSLTCQALEDTSPEALCLWPQSLCNHSASD